MAAAAAERALSEQAASEQAVSGQVVSVQVVSARAVAAQAVAAQAFALTPVGARARRRLPRRSNVVMLLSRSILLLFSREPAARRRPLACRRHGHFLWRDERRRPRVGHAVLVRQ